MYVPEVIPQAVLGNFPKAAVTDRFCGVCLGLSKPTPERVFEALFADLPVDVVMLDVRMPTFETYDEHTVPSVPEQLARHKKKAADAGRPCVVQDLCFTLHGLSLIHI